MARFPMQQAGIFAIVVCLAGAPASAVEPGLAAGQVPGARVGARTTLVGEQVVQQLRTATAAAAAQSETRGLRIQRTQTSLTEALAQLPAPELARPYRFLRSRAVTQAEAEQLMGNADAAIYLADRQEIRFLLSFAADVDIEKLGVAAALSANTAKLVSDAPLPLIQRTEELGVATLVEFANVIAEDVPGSDAAQQANFIVKLPSVITRPDDGAATTDMPPLPVKTINATDYYLFQDFEGDVWSYWSRGDNTGGAYKWADKTCNAHWGSYSGDAVRAGTQGSLLGCTSNYPQSVKTWMYASVCETIGPIWNAWMHLYLNGTIGSGSSDYFAVYVPAPDTYLWGYRFWGNWPSWYKLVFNLRQWYYLGDLPQNYCNTLYLYFSSSSATPTGSGPSIDDFRIDYGPTATTYGQCQISASPVTGSAPLTVSFQGLTDLSSGTYHWDFQDGSTSTALNPTHVFTTAGTYDVYFQAQYSGIFGSATRRITVLPGTTCSYSLSTTNQSFGYAGGTGSIGVVASSGCAWTASTNAAWITVTSGSSGSGNGTVGYSVATNSGSARSGTMTIAGQLFTVYQDALSCSYSISPSSASVGSAGGSGSFGVTTSAGCAWTANSDSAWLTVAGFTGNGSGTVSYSVASNAGSARTGHITVQGQTFTVNQTAVSCTYSISPSSANVGQSGGSGSFGVAATAGCPWTSVSDSSWLHITGGNSGSGTGTVSYSVDANGGSARSGHITVQGQIFTVNQASGIAVLNFSHWIAAASHVDGAGSSHWRSDVAVLNRSTSQATVEYRLYTSEGLKIQQVALPGNGQDLHRDIAAWLGYWSGSGALEVRSDQDVFIMGRTYNQVDSTHSYGQNYDGQEPDSSLLSAGQSAWLPLLAQSSGFRCNIAITNTGTTTANVTLTLYDGQGNLLWSGNTESSAIASGGFIQYQTPFQRYTGRNDLENAYAKVTVNSGSGIIVWASVVDNVTGDPTTIFMKR